MFTFWLYMKVSQKALNQTSQLVQSNQTKPLLRRDFTLKNIKKILYLYKYEYKYVF